MKLKINKAIETEIEIQIPSFYQASCYFFKVFSEERVIAVCDLTGHEQVAEQHIGIIHNSGSLPIEISERAFNKKLNSVIKNLKSA